jgi:hypothetical protein
VLDVEPTPERSALQIIGRRGLRMMSPPGVDDRGSRTVPAGERGRVPAALAPPDHGR